eukprot:GHVU01085091.1.p1 GENE.GHVU01085091.1~~GHVU01085091.1.p1  ORF type:complete len:100 (-),score=2.21 GHVU01085091.1:206-505(-)
MRPLLAAELGLAPSQYFSMARPLTDFAPSLRTDTDQAACITEVWRENLIFACCSMGCIKNNTAFSVTVQKYSLALPNVSKSVATKATGSHRRCCTAVVR